MITQNRNNAANILEAIEKAIQKKVATRLAEARATYTPVYEMEELPDQKKRLTLDDLKRIARRVERHSAAGTNDDETEEENGSESGKEKTLLQIEDLELKESLEDILNEDETFSKSQIDQLRKMYGSLNKIDPDSPSYKKIIKLLDNMSSEQIKQVADAKIKFLSPLARNRVRGLKEGETSYGKKLDEIVDYKKNWIRDSSESAIMNLYYSQNYHTFNEDNNDDLSESVVIRDNTKTPRFFAGSKGFEVDSLSKNWTTDQSKAKTFKSEKEAGDFIRNNFRHKAPMSYDLISESAEIEKAAKGNKDVQIELDDGEEFELDADTAKVLVSKASERELKAAMKDYESMLKLINKALR